MCHLKTKEQTKKIALAHMKFTRKLTKELLHNLNKREKKFEVHNKRDLTIAL